MFWIIGIITGFIAHPSGYTIIYSGWLLILLYYRHYNWKSKVFNHEHNNHTVFYLRSGPVEGNLYHDRNISCCLFCLQFNVVTCFQISLAVLVQVCARIIVIIWHILGQITYLARFLFPHFSNKEAGLGVSPLPPNCCILLYSDLFYHRTSVMKCWKFLPGKYVPLMNFSHQS